MEAISQLPVLAYHGRHEEALICLEKARRLNPLGTYMLAGAYFDSHYMMGDYEKALEVYRGEGDPPVHMLICFAAAHAQLGRSRLPRAWSKSSAHDHPA